jgi:hypothetical protein
MYYTTHVVSKSKLELGFQREVGVLVHVGHDGEHKIKCLLLFGLRC